MPKVSVITPCYNSEQYVGQTIESVRSQTLTDWEHVVVDDGSTDGSADVVNAYLAREPRLRLVRQPNGGVSSARNRAFKASSPESAYLLFLDADDCLKSQMLETVVAYMDDHPEVGLLHCEPAFIDAESKPLDREWLPRYTPSRFGVRILQPGDVETPFVSVFTLAGIIPSLALMRRSVFVQTSGWDETFGQIYEDTDMFLNLAIRSKVHYLPQALVLYRLHGRQSTADLSVFPKQEDKLYAKWSRRKDLTNEQHATVMRAERFRQQRLIPYLGFITGTRYLREGQINRAIRFIGGAVKRYVAPGLGNTNLS